MISYRQSDWQDWKNFSGILKIKFYGQYIEEPESGRTTGEFWIDVSSFENSGGEDILENLMDKISLIFGFSLQSNGKYLHNTTVTNPYYVETSIMAKIASLLKLEKPFKDVKMRATTHPYEAKEPGDIFIDGEVEFKMA